MRRVRQLAVSLPERHASRTCLLQTFGLAGTNLGRATGRDCVFDSICGLIWLGGRRDAVAADAESEAAGSAATRYRSTSLIRNCPPSQDCHRALGIVLLQRAAGSAATRYRSTSLIINCPPLGPYGRPVPRDVWWS